MTFPSLPALVERLRALGANRVLAKALAENDNTKQQVYLGGSFDSLNQLPYGEVTTDSIGARPTFKAALRLCWIDAAGHVAPAPHAKLILYPRYPEVRLSGFLRGCELAPSKLMQPVPRHLRGHNNATDGRVLFLGVSDDGTVYAYLAAADSAVSREFMAAQVRGDLSQAGVFWSVDSGSRAKLLAKLHDIHVAGWHDSMRLDGAGNTIAYVARNGAGYTLEALFGIRPNARAAPDFAGWEIKAFGSSRITLMTPEPDVGFYGAYGVEAFVRKYGYDAGGDVLYFTGLHRFGGVCDRTRQTLTIRGFDPVKGKITDVNGGIELSDDAGGVSAGWSFARLLEHWGRKHASAAYVPYSKRDGPPPQYWFRSPVLLGEGTEFSKFLLAMSDGSVVYDPGPKVERASTGRPRVKARSQFRMGVADLPRLYDKFNEEEIG